MAIVAVITGGLLGFFSFLTALFAFKTSFMVALGLYSAVGLFATLAILLAGILIPRIQRQMRAAAEHEDLKPASF